MGKGMIYFLILSLLGKGAPCKNPLVSDDFEDRWSEYICTKYGCVTTGAYYGMPQATCSRCGHKNCSAGTQVKEWRLPDRYDT